MISTYKVVGTKLEISTPYSDQVANVCREWGGKWNGKSWVVASTRLRQVQEELGVNVDDLVEVEVGKGEYTTSHAQLRLGWYILAGRRARDHRAELYADLVVGTIPPIGGSMKYPTVDADEEVRFRLWVPRDFATKQNLQIITDPKIADDPKPDKKAEAVARIQNLMAELGVSLADLGAL